MRRYGTLYTYFTFWNYNQLRHLDAYILLVRVLSIY